MRSAISNKNFTLEEYISQEWSSVTRHEFINGQLYEIPGEKDINNEIAFLFAIILKNQLSTEYKIYNHDVKVKIHGEEKYYYPDVFVSREKRSIENQYIKFEPILIAEVVSPSSQVNDYVDKYIDYTKVPSLNCYLIIEPETTLLTKYERVEGFWIVEKYVMQNQTVKIKSLNIEFQLKEIYP